MIVYYAGYSGEAFTLLILINVFVLLSGIATSLFLTKRETKFEMGHFLTDFKTAMQTGIIYTISVASFIYLYHTTIDTSIIDNLTEERITFLHESMPDSETFEKVKLEDPSWQNKSYDDYIENQEDQIHGTFSAISVFIVHLGGLGMFSFFYSFFVTLVMRKVVLKNMK